MRAFVLVFCKSLESILDLTPPPLAQLCCTWALAHVGEYVRIVLALVSSTFVAPSDEIMGVFCLFQSFVEVDFLPIC
jgi:hypothetical protein